MGITKPGLTKSFYITPKFEKTYKDLAIKFRGHLPKEDYGSISDMAVIKACVEYCASLVATDDDVIDDIANCGEDFADG